MRVAELKSHPLLRHFNDSGSWYTSYPSLAHWQPMRHDDITGEMWSPRDLHLYVHIPFCQKLCYYCICNVVITQDREKVRFFIDKILKEARLLSAYRPRIKDIHLGGGTPSYLSHEEFSDLCEGLEAIVPLKSLDEFAMEIDPRTVKEGDLEFYASRGVKRISFGIQDFDPDVQRAINRVQPYEMVKRILAERDKFEGVNFDLLYGLPKQSHETISRTVDQVLELMPERITLLKYCHAPDVRRHMKLIRQENLPPEDQLPIMFLNITQRLLDAGYLWIGMDHFCRPGDSLTTKVGRTFNGFSSGTTDMVGLGPTTTGVMGPLYYQSEYELPKYYAALDRGEFPVTRGYRLDADDLARREVIFSLLCQRQAVIDPIYFAREIELLEEMPELCRIVGNSVELTVLGRVLVRHVCSIFDVKDNPQNYRIAQRSMTRRVA